MTATSSLPVAALSDWERYEGMLVTLPQPLTVTETFTLGRFGEVGLSVGRPPATTRPSIVDARCPSAAQQDLNNRRRILLDDGNGQQNIDPTIHPIGGLSASNTLRSGTRSPASTESSISASALYRIQPVGPVAVQRRQPTAGGAGRRRWLAAGRLDERAELLQRRRLGGGFPTARGAETPFEFVRQRAKIVAALVGIDADVVGLMEIENDSGPNSAVRS